MSIGPVQDEFQRQLDIAQKVMERDRDLLRQLPDKLEGRPMAAPSSIKGFPGTLRDALAKLTARIQAEAGEFEKSASNMHSRLDDTSKLRKEIDSVAAEVQQITGMDNGGPA